MDEGFWFSRGQLREAMGMDKDMEMDIDMEREMDMGEWSDGVSRGWFDGEW
jgi:hypothetical protein